jgi:uncharacterized protein (DUF1810 family)
MSSLDRFKKAQADPYSGFDSALSELRTGRKQGHWIWYVFPQIAGLGSSAPSQVYSISGVDEALEYLQDQVLCERLLTITTAVAEQLKAGNSLDILMGQEIDAVKLVSSLTLFGAVARRISAAEGHEALASLGRVAAEVLSMAKLQGYPPCQFTLGRLPDRP